MNIRNLYNAFLESTGINTDTRSLLPGQMFIALVGENFNGNTFAKKALDNGCSCAVISESFEGIEEYSNVFLVEDTLETLQELARFHRSKLKIPVIGLTGSNGKTTSKELLHASLSQKYNCYATKGNLNNHIGVPLSILEIKQEHEIAIIEMGANHQKEIAFLCSISQPDIGFITNIGLAHLEGFGGEEGVYIGKKELFDYLRSTEGDVFVNLDDKKVVRASDGKKAITYGHDKTAIYQGDFTMNDDLLQVTWWRNNTPESKYTIQTNLSGSYNFHNVMSAVAVSRFYGVTPEEIQLGIGRYLPTNNRSQVVNTKKKNKVIVDCYNANPSSMRASVENLNLLADNNAVAILGDMLEVGERTQEEHIKILDQIDSLNIGQVYVVGSNFAEAVEFSNVETHHFFETVHLAEQLKKNPLEGKTILLKGSRKMKLEQLLELL